MPQNNPHLEQPVLARGAPLTDARRAFILLHGRGGSAQDILDLGRELGDPETALIAPQAAGNTWYPNSFLAPLDQNEPWLNSAIAKVVNCVEQCLAAGLGKEHIAIIGFSQGACLASEFVARNPTRYGALIAFTGGLIGPRGIDLHHPGSLMETPVLLSSGDPDSHVPWARVQETQQVLQEMGAIVCIAHYPNRPHTITAAEVIQAREVLSAILLRQQ
jgi:phospholipase/carboxylesterase